MTEDLYKFKQELTSEGIIFCFNGPTSQDVLVTIGDALRMKMQEEDVSMSTTIKVFSVFVEQVQNIIYYSAEKINSPNNDLRLGIIAVGRKNNKYYVVGGNLVQAEKTTALQEKLSIIQNMDKKQLKSYYKEQRKKGRPETSKGAGLGFIEMARKSSEPISYDIKIINEDVAFFSFKAII
ncbi:ATP-binding protein [Candidatus Magnetomoraceae bacterium gMMP-15]